MLKRLFMPFMAVLFVFVSCDSFFIEKGSVDALKAYEKKVYVLRKDMDVEGKKLKKGEEVRIVVSAGKEWVKVHAFPARENELKADRVLLLYLFDDDFQNKKFNIDFFNEQLSAVAAARGDVSAIEKAEKKKKK
ncbi:MAG: type II secretion system-associated lipoprotein [Spirochaetes bacterium]|nr:type II secretion system-associated lipoprotein [Spirochaetota bacterium]